MVTAYVMLPCALVKLPTGFLPMARVDKVAELVLQVTEFVMQVRLKRPTTYEGSVMDAPVNAVLVPL